MKFIDFRLLKKSFLNAKNGLIYSFCHEQNFRLGSIIGLIVIFFTFYFPLSIGQRVTILLLVALFLILELLNSVLERTIDLFKPRIDPAAGIIKQMMSGILLVVVIFSIIIGLIIFLPYFIK
ncbi:MAG: diacylglycerol kinase family protein [Patescibacteria group bacterium]